MFFAISYLQIFKIAISIIYRTDNQNLICEIISVKKKIAL